MNWAPGGLPAKLLDVWWIKVCIALETAPQICLCELAVGSGTLGHSSSNLGQAGTVLHAAAADSTLLSSQRHCQQWSVLPGAGCWPYTQSC
jgi:hypothetical protein